MKKTLLLVFALGNVFFANAQNLILNPSCDDSLVSGEIPQWQEIIGTNFTQACGGAFPAFGGSCFFYPGNGSVGELAQVIDISSDSSIIDNGFKNYYFTGYTRSFAQNPSDESNIFIEFKNGVDTLLVTYHLGPYNQTVPWLRIDSTLLTPIGSRKINLRLHSVRHNGNSNDGNYDELYLGGTPFSNAVPIISIQSSDTSFCEKQCINFTDLSTNNPTSWQWFFPGADSTSSALQNPTNICYNNYGSFDVTLIACNGNGCDTLFLPNFINEYHSPSATISQSNDTLFSSSALTYQWFEITSGIISGATYQYFVPTQPGSYFCLITDSIGCNASSNTIAITSIFNPPISHFQFQIQPNPNDGNFTISLSDFSNENLSITISNLIGQKLKEFNLSYKSFEVNLNQPNGIYFLTITSTKGSYSTKIIIQHDGN